jgi:hypothetical protein
VLLINGKIMYLFHIPQFERSRGTDWNIHHWYKVALWHINRNELITLEPWSSLSQLPSHHKCLDDILIQKLNDMTINGPLKMSFRGSTTFSDLFMTLKKTCHHKSEKVKRNAYNILHKESAHSRSNIILHCRSRHTKCHFLLYIIILNYQATKITQKCYH